MSRNTHVSMIALLVVLVAIGSCKACVELLGHAHAKTDNSSEWDYAYLGHDWEGHDAKGNPWTCMGGHFQSPIDLPKMAPPVPLGLKTIISIDAKPPMGRPAAEVWNNGHTIQVQNFSATLTGISIPSRGKSITDLVANKIKNVSEIKYVYVPAIQFHFHTASEHQIDGMHASLELHVVHKSAPNAFSGCPTGCLSVIGTMIKVAGEIDNPALAPIFDHMPFKESSYNLLPEGTVIDFNKIYPKKRTYITYKGSLTSPPCTEGLLWHVFTEAITISHKQYAAYRNAVGAKKCTVAEPAPPTNCTLAAWDENYRVTQPRLGRHIYMAA